jgi:hypothetical protein
MEDVIDTVIKVDTVLIPPKLKKAGKFLKRS